MDAKHELREIDRVMRELASEAKDALNQVCLLQQALSARDRRIRDLEQALGEAVKAMRAAFAEIEGGPCDIDTCPHTDCATAKLRQSLAHCREVLEAE